MLKNLFKISPEGDVHEILLNQILIIATAMSSLTILSNILIGFPFDANYKWALVIALTLLVKRFHKKSEWVAFSYILFIICIILPLGWYNSGANNNNVVAYVFLMIIAITFLFHSTKRIVLVLLTTFVFISLIFIEFKFNTLLPHYSPELIFSDRLVQISISLISSYLMLQQFANAYMRNNNTLRTQSEKLRQMAYEDQLTGIHNRAFIFEEFEASIRHHKPFVTAMIDVDDFKGINDHYGHLVGDRMLAATGALLRRHFTDRACVARYGGDEFIIIIYDDLPSARQRLDVFVEAFHQLPIVLTVSGTLSIGYAPFQHDTLDGHLKDVDEALYRAKESGKNAVNM